MVCKGAAALAGLLACVAGCRSPLLPLALGGPDGAADGVAVEAPTAPEVPEEAPPPQAGTPLPPREGARACEKFEDCSWWQCPDPFSLCCAGQCTNTRDDPRNCGACGAPCPDGQLCAEGKCRPAADVCQDVTCDPGWICCGGSCVKPSAYYSDCGGCAVECSFMGATCRAGVCCANLKPDAGCGELACPDGQVLCAEGCRDITRNPLSCGGCGIVCPDERPHCVSGTCRP